MYNVSIPNITEEEMIKRYKKIKPIVEIGGDKYFLRDFDGNELTGISYIWNAQRDVREKVNMDEYIALEEEDFECIHKYGYYALFKPSIAEALAQIPANLANIVDLFEIIEEPKTAEDFCKNKMVFESGYHISKVRLYVKRR